ncbi:probable ATP-dependent RNA helicase DDX60-like isoform X2 [Trachypithecus francoisi]|uniref:probable ATP-dependent RNA helicase DDX60-like isoform X2 n=1 Tax=Trachypithecus francoisi TaxID=54180 RepID=UPI00141AFE5A|nr:probable ATP-dependent RNA helicase DDX60-like isoform X2 [Trachypithecus francoisi]XP_033071525.1 probable ATP-dependent RNA helicase DDX60-like isoform X2 [Trachypithecus francoisi]XP_033071526.1 probable ATP-dependent RNA helicase DDX60-like isoform X2 [Trachypithecus francoisi]XP_033071527.1 probable ATP-dependent RNA helicase DDX60-like isoform X2 [Trachypithecus francoisi]XP_033071529.1 probable ATP-dependent RNA helicase DDX60-like isoform X2 [Trachypithecus francoisi]
MGLKDHAGFFRKMTKLILNEMPKAGYSSILNDFVESNFFVIDGDSLLVTCLCVKSFKWGQNLHFFYLVECYLVDLMSNGGQFAIVFFKDAEYAYFDFPELLSLRTALILHLQHNTNIDVQTEFSGCLSQDWKLYLEQHYPYFLIVSEEGLSDVQTYLFNFLIIHSWGMKVNVVLSSGHESDTLRLYAHTMESTDRNQTFSKKNETVIQSAYKSLIQHLEERRILALAPHFEHLKWNDMMEEACQTLFLLQCLCPEGSDIQRVICVTSCSLSLRMYHHHVLVHSNCLSLQEVEDFCRLRCLCVAFQLHLPLSQRACSRVITYSWLWDSDYFLKMNKWCEHFILSNLNVLGCWNLNLNHVSDLYDEQLLKNIAFYYEFESTQEPHLNLGDSIRRDYEHLWNVVSHLVKEFDVGKCFPLRTTRRPFLGQKKSVIQEISLEKMPSVGFVPMTSSVIDEFVGDMMKDLPILKSDDPVVPSQFKEKTSDELLHWHAQRLLSDDYDRIKCHIDEQSRDPHVLDFLKKSRDYQQFYGKSLESISTKVIVTETAQPKEDSSGDSGKMLQNTKPSQITKKKKKKKKAFLKEDQNKDQQKDDLLFSIEEEMKTNLHSGIRKLEEYLTSCASNSVKFGVEMSGLIACFKAWKEHCRGEGKISKDLSIAVQMMKRIHSLLERYPEILEAEHHQYIAKCLKYLGFNDLANSLDPTLMIGDDKKKKKYSIDIGPARFQLQYMGHYLIRDERKNPDPRIQDFIPNTWQRELLDVVDKKESAVIVAPVSAGKTYASYYCMEKVLRESDDGVVVYIAPAKSLVGQVAATVENRFTKTLPAGRTLCGAFTRDYRHNVLNCQVLITVPECFEILLLAPHRQKWVERIRYVIFDEVHYLGREVGAKFWELLLVIIRCPFLVLSATINNPALLTEWLQSVKQYWKQADKIMEEKFISEKQADKCLNFLRDNSYKNQSYEVRLVLCEERDNDLEKHICSVKHDDVYFGHFHPCAALTTDIIEKYGFPPDLILTPQESIQLYDTMAHVWEAWPRAQELCPEEFILFKNKIVIKKLDARKYEENLKAELTNWIKNGKVKKVKRVLKNLSPDSLSSSEDMVKMFPLLVEKLRQMDKLPAIFFLFNNGDVEKRAGSVCTFLEKIETKSHLHTECHSFVFEIDEVFKKVKQMEKTQKRSIKKNPKKAKKLERKLMYRAEYINFLENLKILEISEDHTYADVKALHTEVTRDKGSTLDRVLQQVRFTRNGKELKALAQRGIGYHHSGMYFKEKEFVEILFVKGLIRVVTATGTLASGIHMPCKSVVFAQDSVYLDALNYRQMSGRAGRRGQDLLGNVYFFDIPLPKIKRLLASSVPELRGQFPLSVTLVLRLMLLASKGDDPEDAKAKVLSVLKHSLLSFKRPRAMKTLKLYFLFSLQLLIKEDYLNKNGTPKKFAGLASYLHGHEPSNLVFVNFLKRGLFHNLCTPAWKGAQQFSQDVMEKLVLVLANLFARKYIPAKFQNADLRFSQSKVILAELPEDFKAALHEYNLAVMKDFASFLLIASKSVNMKNEYQLPLSRIKFTGKECEDSQLVSHLMSCKEGRAAVSPFVCLSGNADNDLLRPETVNQVILRTIGVSSAQAPLLWPGKLDNRGRRMPLNAYVLNFYQHNCLTRLEQTNGMRMGQLLKCLKDFAFSIQAISDSLSELCENEHDNVVLAFKQLSHTFYEKLEEMQTQMHQNHLG